MDGRRERKRMKKKKASKTKWMTKRPFFKIVFTARIRTSPGSIPNEEGLQKTHTHTRYETHTHTHGHTWSRGKMSAMTLNSTPPKWIAAVLAPKVGTANTFSYLHAFNTNLFLTHHPHWKPTCFAKHTLTFRYSSQCKQEPKNMKIVLSHVRQDITAAYKTIRVWQIRISLPSLEAVKTHRVA